MPAAEEPQPDTSTQSTPEDPPEEQPEAEEEGDGAPEGDTESEGEGEKPEQAKDDDDGPLTVTLGDEEAPPPPDKAATKWRETRHKIRDLERENRELRAKTTATAPVVEATDPGPRPTLKDPDVDYDSDRLTEKIERWVAAKTKADEAKAKARAKEQEARANAERTAAAYREKAKALGADDYPEAELKVAGALSMEQQNILLTKSKDPATLVYALAKNDSRLAKLAAIQDPFDYFEALRTLEAGMTVKKRVPTTEPEERVTGGGPKSTSSDKHRERLEAEADRTGDRSKLAEYDRMKRRSKG